LEKEPPLRFKDKKFYRSNRTNMGKGTNCAEKEVFAFNTKNGGGVQERKKKRTVERKRRS